MQQALPGDRLTPEVYQLAQGQSPGHLLSKPGCLQASEDVSDPTFQSACGTDREARLEALIRQQQAVLRGRAQEVLRGRAQENRPQRAKRARQICTQHDGPCATFCNEVGTSAHFDLKIRWLGLLSILVARLDPSELEAIFGIMVIPIEEDLPISGQRMATHE